MAKIVIAGRAVVITSSLKLEDIRRVEKSRPEALILRGGEDGKEPIFRLGTCSGAGSISQYGVEFGLETKDDKLATTTLIADTDCDVLEVVKETVGRYVAKLNQIEETIPAVLAELDAEDAAIAESITVVQ